MIGIDWHARMPGMGVVMICIHCGTHVRYKSELRAFEDHPCAGRKPVDALMDSEGITVREDDPR